MSKTLMDNQDYQTLVKATVLDDTSFIQITFSNKMQTDQNQWLKIKVRPVLIKGQRQLQFSYFDAKKDITKNYSGPELERQLNEALAMPFGQINIQTATGDIQIKISARGKVLITRNQASRPEQAPGLAHNRVKHYLLKADKPDPFLQAIGIMNKQGKILAPMQGKFIQINEFLRVIEQTVPRNTAGPIEIIDCGCGSAYLTFATYHYLNHILKMPVHLIGIDRNPELIDKCNQLRHSLGWPGLEFHTSNIADFQPIDPPDMVLSLHACDTATDQVIAKGILWQSRVILAAPCCQHELHHQLHAELFRPILRHGILKERLSDILTDTFRALVLRIMGYNTGVIEFVAPENTAKNLLIRAEKGLKAGEAGFIKEYQDLKDFWKVTPVLETMLGEAIQRYLN
jgi:SAM-dependent methyltransferase